MSLSMFSVIRLTSLNTLDNSAASYHLLAALTKLAALALLSQISKATSKTCPGVKKTDTQERGPPYRNFP